METVFVIGGIGSGKSTAVRALESIGAPTLDLDKLGHEVLESPETQAELAKAFGTDVIERAEGSDGAGDGCESNAKAGGKVNRGLLASRAFASPEATRTLNDITQPRILQLLQQRLQNLEQEGCPACVVEVSAFDGRDSSFGRMADTIVAVVAPLPLRIERAMARGRGTTRADVEARIAAQMSDEERVALADVVFVNDSTMEDLFDAVASWWHERQ